MITVGGKKKPELFKRVPLRAIWLDRAVDLLDGLIGARRGRAAKIGGGDGRVWRPRVAQARSGCASARTALVGGVGARKGGLDDAVVAVRPKAAVAARKQDVVGEIGGGVGPKGRCRPLGSALSGCILRRLRRIRRGLRRDRHGSPRGGAALEMRPVARARRCMHDGTSVVMSPGIVETPEHRAGECAQHRAGTKSQPGLRRGRNGER